ncbi:MAG: ABC transporter substrate-binding protein [bacterium]
MRQRVLALALVTFVPGAPARGETIVLRAWTIGPEDAAITRATNLEKAAETLSAELATEGSSTRVRVEASFATDAWDAYRRRVLLGFESGKVADIVQSAHVDIAPWSEAGYLVPLDEHLSAFPQFADVRPSLWAAVTYRGRIWGVPQDTEARPLYFNRKLLAACGWTAAEIESLPRRIRAGEFTWDDLLRTARDAVAKGVVREGHGWWHRPLNGADFFHTYYAFGGELSDAESGRLVLSREAARATFGLFERAVRDGVTKRDLVGTALREWHRTVTADRVLFASAGTWTWAEWATEYVDDRGGFDHLAKTWGFALHPAAAAGGRPTTLSQPQAYMIWKGSPHADLAVRLLAHATTPELDARHALGSAHLAILTPTAKRPDYSADAFASAATLLLDFTTYQPLHPRFGQFSETFFRGVASVESGQFTAEEATEIVAEELERRLGDDVIVR